MSIYVEKRKRKHTAVTTPGPSQSMASGPGMESKSTGSYRAETSGWSQSVVAVVAVLQKSIGLQGYYRDYRDYRDHDYRSLWIFSGL